MSKENPALNQHWAMMLVMDLGQEGSVDLIFWACVTWWQVENLSAPVTLIVRGCMCAKFFKQGRHDHWGPNTAFRVQGFDMFAKNCRVMLTSAKQAVLSQKASKSFIRPQVFKVAMYEDVNQGQNGNWAMRHRLQKSV